MKKAPLLLVSISQFLSGHAASQSDIAKIVDAAQSVSGVKRVINNIHVQ